VGDALSADSRSEVGGLVESLLSLSLTELRRLSLGTPITKHDCIQGWTTAIAEWASAPPHWVAPWAAP
jgi:DMSO/TMAO reductase YedYZ molybdopterin-dependent catalytic subunit